MRLMLICAATLALSGGVALADEVTIHRDVPAPGVIVEHRAADVDVHKKVITHEDGCATKTVKKTNGVGDTMIKSKSNC